MDNSVVFGLDILPGYSALSRTRQPHFSLVILSGDRVIAEYDDITFTRLIRMIWEYKPNILAVDNVFELVKNNNELAKLYSILPPNTRIVQTTGWSIESKELNTIAQRYGLNINGKPNPLRTAYISAIIASMGGGYVIKLTGEKTKIIVTRNRSVSQGGSSCDRFKRSIRASILNVTREIKKILDDNNLDYDIVYRKSKGGLESSVFIVYSPRDKLYGLIKPFKNKNVKVIIKPVYGSKVIYEDKKSETIRKGLILGLDPGMSIGLAVIDLNGNPIYLDSFKNIDRDEIINTVSKLGEVVIVASDTHRPPELVKKISSILNAKLYTPPYDLSNEEKQEIMNKVLEKYRDLNIRDNHIRDALASAYKALYSIRDKLDLVDSKIKEINIDLNIERIKINVIKGMSFAEALEKELEKYVEKLKSTLELEYTRVLDERKSIVDEIKYIERIKELKSRIAYLESIINELTNQLRERDRLISDLKIELKTTRSLNNVEDFYERKIYLLKCMIESLRKEIRRRDETIVELNKRISELEDLVFKVSSGNYLVIPRLANLSFSDVKKIIDNNNCKLIYVDNINPIDNDTLSILKNFRIGVLTDGDYGDLYKELRIPIIKINEKIFFKNYVIVDKSILSIVEKMWRDIDELDTIDKYRRIWRIIKEYKESRSSRM
uniref:DUF460 domain-containing protein n=1 Tax=Staphylothermus marinus TaxID=2280 RepID=A0A7C4HC54_STAMA